LGDVSLDQPAAPEPIRADHDAATFDSGVPPLDDWLRRRAVPNEVAGASRTMVGCFDGRVVGYYSLAAGAVAHSVATPRVRRNMPDPIPAVVLGRLAIDLTWQGRGLGGDLLQDAIRRTAGAANTIGVRVLVLHALTDAAKTFYERFGFRTSPLEPMTMMLTIEQLRPQLSSLAPDMNG
jgi:predicted N-acetyltransferase YhbS